MTDFFANPRIGFACKWVDSEPKSIKTSRELVESRNQKTTTIKHLRSLTRAEVYKKLHGIVEHNFKSLGAVFTWLASRPVSMRMMRISSDFLPAYTHEEFSWVYEDSDMLNLMERKFAALGQQARKNLIRVSTHPGQFCILNSTNEAVLNGSIKEFEYHVMMFRLMGYSGWHPYGLEINVHGGSKNSGLENLKNTINTKLSQEAKDWISIENDEFSFSLDDLLALRDTCAILPDVHHHLINSGGEYIQPNDSRLQVVLESWRGVRPEMHYSLSHEEVLVNHNTTVMPDVKALLAAKTVNKKDLRAHSNDVWNEACNSWVLGFMKDFDIMIESKTKNASAVRLHKQAIKEGYLNESIGSSK